jgi:NADPH-dependent 7-cyano-7-deazaguanine reductase QueF
MTLATVETVADVRCRVTTDISPKCPVVDETDHYGVTVAWDTTDVTLEKHDLHRYLQSFDGAEITQEELAHEIALTVRDAGVVAVEVRVQDTEHMDMEVVADG